MHTLSCRRKNQFLLQGEDVSFDIVHDTSQLNDDLYLTPPSTYNLTYNYDF